MKLHPDTLWIVSSGAVIFGLYGLVSVLRIPSRTLEHWIIHLGGMYLTGVLLGLCVALLATGIRYLRLRFKPSPVKFSQILQP
jgi:hypothetical protein